MTKHLPNGKFRDNHKQVAGTLTHDEARLFAMRAAEFGLRPSTYATRLMREDIAKLEQTECSTMTTLKTQPKFMMESTQ
jgi:hypothetical protein